MLSTLLTLCLSLAPLSSASALPNTKRGSGILALSVAAVNTTQLLPSKHKRQDAVALANVQTGTRYVVTFSIGTPPQPVSVSIDTGSSDTWVDPDCSTAGPQSSIDLCNSYPVYTVDLSSTAEDTGESTTLSYGKGSADVEYYTDNFLLGGATVIAQQFAVASDSTDMPTGLMGVGPGIELTGYPTIIDQLADQGITNSRAFSLDLRSVNAPAGAIIFGGIDTKKYKGSLEKCPIIPAEDAPDDFDRYWINMDAVGITKPGDSPKTYPASSTPVFLDSGGTLSRLPTPIYNAVAADFPGATLDTGGSGLYIVDCSVADLPGTVDFTFGATIINIPYHEFIWFINPTLCVIGLLPEDDAPVLGDSFLRGAYVVYDQDNQNLLLANTDDCGSELVAIEKGPDAVPSVTGACAASTSSSSTSSSTTSSSPTSSTSSLSISTTTSSSSSASLSSSASSSSSSSATSGTSTTASSTASSSSTSSSSASSSSSSVASSSSSSTTTSSSKYNSV
ncbi:acid protease [Lophium mytilinum]|uniref:Acid protease n=1 Tax=Lophium mytilinum TaxID=390894 RepID=A0A6A6QRP3_9PEZI|nr:acid protease [Lophium mytilinum]